MLDIRWRFVLMLWCVSELARKEKDMLQDIQPGMVRKTCLFCGNAFWAHRVDAKFCKKTHRNMYSRWRSGIPHIAERAVIDLQNLAAYLDYPVSRDQSLAELVSIQDKIKIMIEARGIIVKKIR